MHHYRVLLQSKAPFLALGSKVLRLSGTRGSLLVILPLRISKKDLLTNQLPIPSTKTTVKAKSDKIMDLVSMTQSTSEPTPS